MIPQPNINPRIIVSEDTRNDFLMDINGNVINLNPIELKYLPELKSVYCNYRGRVTVYDIHGQKVHELSGMLTYEKYVEIEKRRTINTEFDGIFDYQRIANELCIDFNWKNAAVVMTNTSDATKKAVLFGANENSMMNNFGNSSSFEIQDDGFYQKALNNILVNPLKIESLRIECEDGCTADRNIENQLKSANGQILSRLIETINWMSPTQFQANILEIKQHISIDRGMSLLVPVMPNERLGLFLLEDNSIKLKFAKA